MRSFIAAFLLVSNIASAQNRDRKADPRLVRVLDEEKIEYTIASNGRVSATFIVGDTKRTHQVHIESETSSVDEVEIRQVWAWAYSLKGEVPAPLARRLLMENGQKIVGAWEIARHDDGSSTVIFTAKIAAGADGPTLRSIIAYVTENADALEAELTKKDDL